MSLENPAVYRLSPGQTPQSFVECVTTLIVSFVNESPSTSEGCEHRAGGCRV